jgi:hypothetical protein
MIAEGRGPIRLLGVKPVQARKVADEKSAFDEWTIFGTWQSRSFFGIVSYPLLSVFAC